MRHSPDFIMCIIHNTGHMQYHAFGMYSTRWQFREIYTAWLKRKKIPRREWEQYRFTIYKKVMP